MRLAAQSRRVHPQTVQCTRIRAPEAKDQLPHRPAGRPQTAQIKPSSLDRPRAAKTALASLTIETCALAAAPAAAPSPRMIAVTMASCSSQDLASRPGSRNCARRNGASRLRVMRHQFVDMLAVGAAIEPGVELGVVRLVVLLGAEMDQPRRGLVLALQRPALAGGHALGRKARADAFELGHALEHRGQVLLRHHGDDGAAVGPPVDEPHGAELAKRLADRRARHLRSARRATLRRAFRRGAARR